MKNKLYDESKVLLNKNGSVMLVNEFNEVKVCYDIKMIKLQFKIQNIFGKIIIVK